MAASLLQQAQQQLQQVLNQYQPRQPSANPAQQALRATIQTELENLSALQNKLDQRLLSVAVFGLVSRGKSAVMNALIGQKLLQTGPIHGVTRWPRAVQWSPFPDHKLRVELIDTPGLDEVEGQSRAAMAQQVSYQADLILFVVAGDLTQTEYQAIQEFLALQKPLLLVFNKTDLYPPPDQAAILQKLQQFLQEAGNAGAALPLTGLDIVRVAAEPAPVQVRLEHPDGEVRYEWETPGPEIAELRDRLLQIFNREGQALLALNVLVQARSAETTIVRKTVELQQKAAEDLIWKFAGYKALAVALNPFGFLDVLGGFVTDLAVIRGLSRLYTLPMTNYKVEALWKQLLWSSGALLVSEWGTQLLFGFDRSLGIAEPGQWSAFVGGAIVQASLAAYGSYRVGRLGQQYLKQGCTWGPTGASTLIQRILSQAPADTVLSRLRRGIEEELGVG